MRQLFKREVGEIVWLRGRIVHCFPISVLKLPTRMSTATDWPVPSIIRVGRRASGVQHASATLHLLPPPPLPRRSDSAVDPCIGSAPPLVATTPLARAPSLSLYFFTNFKNERERGGRQNGDDGGDADARPTRRGRMSKMSKMSMMSKFRRIVDEADRPSEPSLHPASRGMRSKKCSS